MSLNFSESTCINITRIIGHLMLMSEDRKNRNVHFVFYYRRQDMGTFCPCEKNYG